MEHPTRPKWKEIIPVIAMSMREGECQHHDDDDEIGDLDDCR